MKQSYNNSSRKLFFTISVYTYMIIRLTCTLKLFYREISNRFDFFSFDTPVVVRPGDELRTTCTFNSEGVDRTTFFGKGTHDEMCLVFIKYYPKQKARIQKCLSFKELSMCTAFPQTVGLFEDGMRGCNVPQFTSLTNPATLTMVFQVRTLTDY